MSPYPLETIAPGGGMMLEQQQQQLTQHHQQPGHISLSVLIDMIVQRTYHELTILAELLPRKTDMERKVEIFNFSSRTRMLFIRLLALVKWASSASKVDKCNNIMMFLDKQSNLFLETADNLARMARETLVRATLPNFHLPAAAEILTTGGYTRLPRCIKERIIPPPAISPQERKLTLLALNQVIEQRLVSSPIPLRMRNLKVADGTVTFTVKNEFEARLTLLGDTAPEPWRLLSLEMLVEDRETGQGKSLIHSLQVNYVQNLVQSRLGGKDTVKPLYDLYNVLHGMAQLLQLEVLYNQTMRLCTERLGDYIRVEEYVLGRALTISYWRELSSRDPNADQGYRLSVQLFSSLGPNIGQRDQLLQLGRGRSSRY
jgi:mediator of RNA polymerase II transcription subunit 14